MRTDVVDEAAATRRLRFEKVAAEVYEPVQRFLVRRAHRDMAAEALSDTLLVLWRRLDDVPDEPIPWTIGVARRSLANLRRGDTRRLRLVERTITTRTAEPTGDPQQAIDDLEPALSAAITKLSAGEAEIIRLWAWERLEAREIAEVLEMTPNAVSVALTRAKRKIAEHLAVEESAPENSDDRNAAEPDTPGVKAPSRRNDRRGAGR